MTISNSPSQLFQGSDHQPQAAQQHFSENHMAFSAFVALHMMRYQSSHVVGQNRSPDLMNIYHRFFSTNWKKKSINHFIHKINHNK